MYLKKIELKGFKSFPNKTEILYNKGITSVVGPNGSGKSNISDAVRWVLGEQSIKNLRGDKLEDVIFVGADSKKPMNYCEVTLVIDNSDNEMNIEFTEISIKRKTYRDGESQFFLNNKLCRLKEIREVLLDTGIGKDGYSIIEQGKVDEILSSNQLNRRKLFDEACGIAKYRYKKQEAEKNLVNTKENLDRIQDVYIEVEKQMKILFIQQEKAVKFINYSDNLKKLEVNNFLKEIDNNDCEIKELTKHLKIINLELKNKEKNNELFEKELLELKNKSDILVDSIEKIQLFINSIKDVISKKEYQIQIFRDRIFQNEKEILEKNKNICEIENKISFNLETLNVLNTELDESNLKLSSINKKIENFKSKSHGKKDLISNLNKSIEYLKEEIITILNNKQDLSSSESTVVANKNNLKNRNDSINNEMLEKEDLIKLNESKLNLNNEQLDNLKGCITELESSKSNLENEIIELKSKRHKYRENNQKNKFNLNEYLSKLAIYKEMENHYEGFNRGVKEVLKNKNLHGICGVIGQLIDVPAKYERAIESGLGSHMQNLVTKDENCAKASIIFLKNNNFGRVTFLPLNVIKGSRLNINKLNYSEKIIGVASELISFNEKYQNVIDSILGRTLIAKNLEDAIFFANKTGHRYKVISLDGEVLNVGGSLTGGSLKTKGNILARKRIIQEYDENIRIFDSNINLLNEKIDKISGDLNYKEQLLIDLQSSIKDKEKNIMDLNYLNKVIKNDNENLYKSIKKLNKEQSSIKNNLKYIRDKNAKITEEMNKLTLKYEYNKRKIEEKTVLLEEEINKFENNREGIEIYNLDSVRYTQKIDSITSDINRIKIENKERELKKIELLNLVDKLNNELKSFTTKIELENDELKNLNVQFKNNKIDLENKKVAFNNIKFKKDEFSKKLKEEERKFLELKEAVFKLNSKLERARSNRENHLMNLKEQYEMSYEDAIYLKDVNLCVDNNYIKDLKIKIKDLGNVNLDSIKEYMEIKERFTFYEFQKKDMEESILSIESIIHTLEKNMKIEFKKQFDLINEKYKYVHNRLFGGGNGELILIDKVNILETDIGIISQPPGKKTKNINLLSGGEKALTAISVLFSILMTKPTPFCILDEIEAALDDINIYRFGEFLKELSERTQFIAITHRRGTMQVSDFIYGVTMQEKAVSKIISLKLNDANKITNII